jgi:hypothetical protein
MPKLSVQHSRTVWNCVHEGPCDIVVGFEGNPQAQKGKQVEHRANDDHPTSTAIAQSGSQAAELGQG